MARTPRKATKPTVRPTALTLTPEARDTVQRLGQEASDTIGRTVGGSAVVRALLTWTAQQSGTWRTEHLFPLIERELATGFHWGATTGKRQSRKKEKP
jgi:hypothetical protein